MKLRKSTLISLFPWSHKVLLITTVVKILPKIQRIILIRAFLFFPLLANDYEEPNHVLITAFGGKQGGHIPPLPELSGKRASKTSNTNKRERVL